MQEFPLSKLKIKIHGINNPTSVFKKKSFLSLNCIHKNKKSRTPLRIFSNDELPHYMLPIKCQITKTEMNDKEPTKLRSKKSNIKITILSRNKSNNEIKMKQSKDIKKDENNKINNNINNIYNTITFNKNNLNTNFFGNSNLNDYSSSNKENNENIISELNIINHNSNNNNNNNTSSFEEPSFQSLISELQKKINEQNILLSSRKKEIEELKKQLNKSSYKNKDLSLNADINNKKNSYEINNEAKNEINNLQEEIRNLKQEIESLNNKYQNELNDKKAIEEKYKFLKNSVKNNSSREKDKNYYENKIIEQENKIIALEEELNEQKNKKFEISKTSHFELFIQKNNNNKINDLILNQKQYNDIQLILNVLLDLNNIDIKNLSDLIGTKMEKCLGINEISSDICNILKISDKDKNIINNYINDLLLKSEKENADIELELENLFKYKYNDHNNVNNEKINFVMNSENKKILYEKCKNFDYKNKHKIPLYYFKHIYKEICHKNNNSFSSNEFFNLLFECKKYNGNEIYCLYDILYENLIKNEEEEENTEINTKYKLKYPDLVKNFLSKIIKEAFDKKKEKFGNNQLNRARSFEKDFLEQDLISNNVVKNNENKLNLDEGDE